MSVWKWSQTANNNDAIDSTINLREGQAPRTYNNAVRAVMAAVRKWWDDLSGNIVTGGGSTAYTVTSNQSYTGLPDGHHVVARIHTTNGTDPTLAVDGQTAKPIRYKTSTAIPSGAMAGGSTQKFTYDASDDCYYVHGWFEGALRSADNPDLVALEAVSTTGVVKRTGSATFSTDNLDTIISFSQSSGHSSIVLPTGVMKARGYVPFACTVIGYVLQADQEGDIVIDLWREDVADGIPTNDDSITASAPPTLTNQTYLKSTTLTSWTTAIPADSYLVANIDSVDAITEITLHLIVRRFA